MLAASNLAKAVIDVVALTAFFWLIGLVVWVVGVAVERRKR
ncbi:MAG TPA: hypothetical protein VGH79_01610 [Gaiellaceae bacterium]|jgi:type IV secretory pathway TrbD component